MLLTVAADCILAPFEGLQVAARYSNALRLGWASLRDGKPVDFTQIPNRALLSKREFAPSRCQITDDTVLAFAVKSAVHEILSGSFSVQEQKSIFERELRAFALKYREEVKGFGMGFESWLKNPQATPTSTGNGVLMRMQAILDLPLDNPNRERLSVLQASITHGPEAVQMARAFESAHRRTAILKTYAEREDFLAYCSEKLIGLVDVHGLRGKGRFISNAKDTLGLACWIAANSLSWDDLFDLVAWIGGDTDTLGVVSAQLAALTLGEFAQASKVAQLALKNHPGFTLN